ncbi:natural product biosynthesis luciferase-like monooxygenase domain-containing protein [Chitinophaga rupis]|uniref:Natural product biosynthesis luciferase-like monooxygenase domain-containing protein n=1 Tax=Chitinophaga rupis TaxID=573321 RepID=A0A1H8B5E3_9BACT|nr:MupA/Atu3671 family FMN-dependent luciferase-like monooxygenase [Chitinophaga rupis]SEM78112.1 natural product biosynthesis luciferase-like monooxygenase domain-containing protein [Chitinophaga rupis]
METASLLKQIREQGIDIKLSGDNLELTFQKEDVEDSVIALIKENKPGILAYLKSVTAAGRVEQIPLAEEPDYAARAGNKEQVKADEAYWLEKLAGELPVLNLPTYKTRPALKTYNGATYTHIYDPQLLQRLRTFSSENKGTLFMALMAGVNALLYRYTNQTDIIVGTPVAGRNHPDLQGRAGLYVNTLPVRMQFEATYSFTELFALQSATLRSVYTHSGYSFDGLVNKLQVSRDVSRSPLFDVLVTHQQKNDSSFDPGSGFSVSEYDITFTFFEDENDLSVSIEYNTDLFQQQFIKRLANNLENFMRESLVNPQQQIQRISYLDAEQMRELLYSFNDTEVKYDTTATVISLFQQQVKRTPGNIALVCEGAEISYRQLSDKADQLALYLRSVGVTPGTTVGVCLGRSIAMMTAILGILKAGAAYLPMDPFYPLDRIDYIADHSGTKFILTDSQSKDIISTAFTAINVEEPEIWSYSGEDILPVTDSAAIAYVIYTSGSTGKPKGVKVSHRNLVNFITGMEQRFIKETAVDVWLAMTSISFDISILELLWTLTRGDKVVIHLERPAPILPQPAVDFSIFYFPTGVTRSNTNKYKLLIEGARFADQHGFKAIWVPERHFHSFGDQFPNPSVAAAAVSTITQNIRIRSGSVVLPLHDPVRVAEEWSMIDNLSNGRVELSIASGWHPNDFVLAPNEFHHRQQSMRDKITILTDLWQGGSLTRQNGVGKDFEFKIHPRPIQEKLPLWITSGGGIDTFKYAGSIGANVLTHLLGQSIEELGEKIKAYRQALHENGFDDRKGKVALMVHTFVSDNADMVRKVVEPPFKNYLQNSLSLLKPIAEEKGLDVEQDVNVLLDMGFHRYYSTSSLFGTPETCLDVVNRIYEAGVNEIACLIDFGVDEDLVISNLPHLFTLKELIRRSKIQHDFIVERMNRLTENEDAAALIEQHQVTHMQSTPSFYEEALLHAKGRAALQKISTLLVGGEALKRSLAEKLIENGGRPVHNMYGPTETTIWSTVKTITKADAVTIGTPIANTSIYILDHLHQLCPVGVAGELCIGGDGVALGYLHNEELTASRFIANPFAHGQKIYKTGDLARWLPNGELECLGRLDRQVKIKGYRIELEEIENVMLTYPGVIQCVVAANRVKEQVVLMAYVTHRHQADEGAIKDFLRLRLPAYMLPQHVIILDEFPYTPNGKVDHLRLPRPDAIKTTARHIVAPRNELEAKLAGIWREFLKLDQLSIDDNFFEIGGNSLKAFQLLVIINTALNATLKIIVFFQYPTVRTLAASLNESHIPQKMLVEENELEGVDDLINFMDNV